MIDRLIAMLTLSSTTSMRSAACSAAAGPDVPVSSGVIRRRGEPDGEFRAAARPLAVDPDGPAVQRHEPLDQGQADPQAAAATVERGVGLGEEVEDAGEEIGGDPRAVVADADHRLGPLAGHGELDVAAGVGELRRVVEQVHQDLVDADGVRLQPDRPLGRGRR